MSILFGGGVVAVIAIGYVGRKGWHAFHRVVGITPGKMKYIEPQPLPPPVLIQLNLTTQQQQNLPQILTQQLKRIDRKADLLQSSKDKLRESGHTSPVNEDDFVVQKLLTERLPDMLNSYQRVHTHEQQMAQVNSQNGFQNQYQSQPHQHKPSQNWYEAVRLLSQLLIQIENKLDTLLAVDQSNALQDMQVMERYLEDRF